MSVLLQPKLRFKQDDGSDFPDWEKNKIGNLFEISAGGDIDKNSLNPVRTEEYKYPVYSNSTKKEGLFGFSNQYKADKNSITVSGRGSLGIAVARKQKFYPIVRLLVLKPKNDKENIFFFTYAINKKRFFIESTGVPQLTAPQISKYNIYYPDISEKEKIASFLSSVDKKIDLVKQKIDKTQTFKKGLLQQMFV